MSPSPTVPGGPPDPDAVPARSAHAALRDPAEPLSARAVVYWRLAAVPAAVLAVGLAVALVTGLGGWVSWVGAVALVATSLAFLVLMPPVRYRVHRWEVTDEAVFTREGWLRREVRIVPLARVQTISSTQSVLMRLLDLASVVVTTASSAGAVRIEALDVAVAEDVVARLTRDTAAATPWGDDAT